MRHILQESGYSYQMRSLDLRVFDFRKVFPEDLVTQVHQLTVAGQDIVFRTLDPMSAGFWVHHRESIRTVGSDQPRSVKYLSSGGFKRVEKDAAVQERVSTGAEIHCVVLNQHTTETGQADSNRP